MRYSYPQIVLKEVPTEISLALSISGCSLFCKGCHSSETWNPEHGTYLDLDELSKLLSENKHITCVLFYGGESESELLGLLRLCKLKKLKTCLYTGRDFNEIHDDIRAQLNYIKVGPYIQELGGLDSPTTNQRLFKKDLLGNWHQIGLDGKYLC